MKDFKVFGRTLAVRRVEKERKSINIFFINQIILEVFLKKDFSRLLK